MSIDTDTGGLLLAHARHAIAGELLGTDHAGPMPPIEPALRQPGASFVTLMLDSQLKGCIGSLEAYRALLDDVRANARAAAFSDPRFAPLRREELPRVRVEVSVLTPPEPFAFADEADALARLHPGVDGVILEYGPHRATFLPQVWDALPEPREFLAQLKRKAGLSADFWHPEMRLSRYRVSKWKEADHAHA
jgi:AmmeMemoRadiSam system protein A